MIKEVLELCVAAEGSLSMPLLRPDVGALPSLTHQLGAAREEGKGGTGLGCEEGCSTWAWCLVRTWWLAVPGIKLWVPRPGEPSQAGVEAGAAWQWHWTAWRKKKDKCWGVCTADFELYGIVL